MPQQLIIKLHLADWLVIAVYGAALFFIVRMAAGKPKSSEDYFLASRKLRWPFIGASLFAANISAEHFVGLAGAGFATGMAAGGFEWMAIFCLAPLIFLFLPFYVRNKIYTVPEFLGKRFDERVRLAFSLLMMFLSVLVKISISLWASSIVFSALLGWNQIVVTWVVGLLTALYTMKGGLSIVVYTDSFQTTILICASILLVAIGLHRVGGWTMLNAALGPGMFHMVRPATDPNYPWPGMFIGVFLLGSFYWSMDQVLVQRVFAARNLDEGRRGAIFCGFLKVLTPFLLVLPGLIAKDMFPRLTNPDDAYPLLLAKLMPPGLLGLAIAGIAAALMGHISATYNSVATLFTRDFYLYFRPHASQRRQIQVGRTSVLVLFILGALWAPIIGDFKSLFIYLQTVQAYLMMPLAGMLFMAIFWKRTSSAGVLACIVSTLLLCPTFMFNGDLLAKSGHSLIPGMELPLLRPWLHSALVAFCLCMLVLVTVSVFTPPSRPDCLSETTIGPYRHAQDAGRLARNSDRTGSLLWCDYRVWAAGLFVVATVLWWKMR